MTLSLQYLEPHLLDFITTTMKQDLAHDINHVIRVVAMAKTLCKRENGIAEVVIPAAYLHDCFSFPKNHPLKKQSSTKAANMAIAYLKTLHYPECYLADIHHAIVAHSYSANIEASTLEAQIVQDADRLDSLGAIGIVRCLQVSSDLGHPLYALDDPFCEQREPDDKQYTIDHFYTKLLRLSSTMKTDSARKEAKQRTDYMIAFLAQLKNEIS